ncbi:MAG: methionyl-tRNA formyltransferase [Holophagales bacterium]|jgi:methionyl-tRNA formyltransferase|nr:methionyl-tRNA formyltransferase [Holophagales bacterium]
MLQARIAFLGTPDPAVPPLRALAKSCGVQAVFCNPDRPQGRGRIIEPPPVKRTAIDLGLEIHQPEKWHTDATKSLWESLKIDIALVVAYGHILPNWMIDSCKLGAWNLHFSLLPRWRGAAPVNHAILAGDTETGVSLMQIVPGLDAGPVLAQSRRPITVESTADRLLAELAEDAAELLKANLPNVLGGKISLTSQDETLVTLAPKLKKEMARLDLTKGAAELHRQVRAFQPWPGAEFQLDKTIIKLLKAGEVFTSDKSPGTLHWDKNSVLLSVGGSSAIELITLQRPGKPAQPARQVMQFWGAEGSIALEV